MTNMGAVTEIDIGQFADYVLGATYPDKTWEWTPAGPSINLVEKFLLRRSVVGVYPWQAKEEVLHEIAHFAVVGHGPDFYDAYIKLLTRFMAKQPVAL